MNDLALPIPRNEKIQTAAYSLDLVLHQLEKQPFASIEQLATSVIVTNLSYTLGKDKIYYVTEELMVNGERLLVNGSYIKTANTFAIVTHNAEFKPSGLAFYPIKGNEHPHIYYTDDSQLKAFICGSGEGEILVLDRQSNLEKAFNLFNNDVDSHNITLVMPFDRDDYLPAIKDLAKYRAVTAFCELTQEKNYLYQLIGYEVKLVITSTPLHAIHNDIFTWQDLLNHDETRITQLTTYQPWRNDVELLDNPVTHENGRFEIYYDGLYFVRYDFDSDNNKYIKQGYPMRISDALFIKASIRSKNSMDWGLLLEWKDKDHHRHEWAMPASLLQGDSKELRQILADMGLGITTSLKARNYLTAYLQTYDTPKRALSVNKTGWHENSYVLPHCVINGSKNEPIVLQTSAPLEHGYSVKGTLQDWQNNIAIPVAEQSRLAFALCCAFGGQLLELIEQEQGGGVHFWGMSSIGKSVTLFVAGSVWGKYMIRTWRSTDNGLESIATAHNDSVLCLDEIGECDARIVGKSIYMLANGQAKNRMTKTGLNKQTAKWRLIILSNGEFAVDSYLKQAGEIVKAGQEVRLANIEANVGKGLGIFDSLTLATTPAEQAEQLRTNTSKYYGVAGITWLEYLTQNKDAATKQANEYIRTFLEYYPNLSGQAKRVANRFALLASAGELATKANITGWQAGQAMTATKLCFDNWLENYGSTGNHEQRQIIKQIQAYLQQHGKSRFSPWENDDYASIMPNRVGYYRAGNDSYYIYSALFERELCLPFNKKQVAETLKCLNLLHSSHGYQLNVKSIHRDKKGYFYCIKGEILNLEV